MKFEIFCVAFVFSVDNLPAAFGINNVKTMLKSIIDNRYTELSEIQDTGGIAETGQFPYHVGLVMVRDSATPFSRPFCGGSIIDDKWILTTAVCSRKYRRQDIRVLFGTADYIIGGRVYKIKRIESDYNNGVGLLETYDTMAWEGRAMPVPLNNKNITAGTLLVLTSWDTAEKKNDRLKFTYVYTLETENCRNVNLFQRARLVAEKAICAASVGSDKFPTAYGNPVVADNRLIGIFANSIARQVHVITPVSLCLDWISNITGIITSS